MTLSIHSPDELIAVIPHLLGFKPEESLVFLPMSSELPTARVDLPTTPHDREVVWSSIRDAYGRHAQPGSSLAIVCLTADRGTATGVGHEFAARFDSIGIDTRVMLWADETRWADLDTGDMGIQTDAARERIAAATVLSGRAQPAADRSSLAESLVGDRTPVADLLPETRDAARDNTAKLEGRWALDRMERFHRDGVRLSDVDAARLLVAVESVPTRDRLWLDMHRGNAGSHVALWTDMTQRAPDEVRAAPASLLGFASWLSGHGALAWCALDQVPEDKPYTLANLVAAAVQTGMNPGSGRPPTSRPAEAWTTPPTSSPADLLRRPDRLKPPRDSEEDAVDVTYRRGRPVSRSERLLAWLVRRGSTTPPICTRIDFVRAEPVEVTRA